MPNCLPRETSPYLQQHAGNTVDCYAWGDDAQDPVRIVLAAEPGVPGLPPALDKPWTGGVNAWVCRGVTCVAPVSEVSGLLALLQG